MADPDCEIIERCKKNDRRAQMQLYNTFYRQVYNSCLRILRSQEEAEDAMQESFLKMFSSLGSYQESTPFAAWLGRIAINTSIDKLRRKDRNMTVFDEQAEYAGTEDGDEKDWEDITLQVKQVKNAIDSLTGKYRLVATLHLIEGYSHEEISEILNITHGAARIQYMRAKQQLITLLKN